jgi:hypothetical protein
MLELLARTAHEADPFPCHSASLTELHTNLSRPRGNSKVYTERLATCVIRNRYEAVQDPPRTTDGSLCGFLH